MIDFVAPAERASAHELLAECMRSPARRRIVLAHSGGAMRAVQLSGSALAGADGITLCLVATDLSAIEKAVQEMLRLRDEQQQGEKMRAALVEDGQRMRRKLDNLLAPDGDVGRLRLADLLDTEKLQDLMADFHAVVRIPMSLVDEEGRVLISVGMQDICSDFHRAHPDSAQNCAASAKLLREGLTLGESRLHRCRNDMWDMATPIVVGGRHLGNVQSGQFFFVDETVDRELFRAQARQHGFDETAYLAALDRVPRLERETVNRAIGFFTKLAGMISDLSQSNLKLARVLADHERLTAELRLSEERLRLLGDNLPERAIYQYVHGRDGRRRFLYVSAGIEQINGIKVADLLRDARVLLDQIAPDHRERFRDAEARSRRALSDLDVTVPMRRTDGEIRWMRLSARPRRVPDGTTLWDGTQIDITDRRRAEEALRESEARFRSVLEHSKDLIYRIDVRTDRHEYVSPSALAMTGYTAAEFMAMDGETVLGMIHRDDEPAVQRALIRLCATGKAEVEYRWQKRNGELCWLANSMVLIMDEAGRPLYRNGSIRDVTARKRREEALRLSEEKFNKAFADNPAAIALSRVEDGLLVEVNDTWQRMTGYTREEVLGRSAISMWPDSADRARFVSTLREKGSLQGWEQQFTRKCGAAYTVELSAQLIPVNGEVLVLSTLLDITDRKRSEQALRASHAKLEAANCELEAFTYSVSHDLRSPLRSIDGFAAILADQYNAALNDDARHCLQMVRDATQRMGQLIDHLLAFSRLGQQPLHAGPVSMEALVQAALRDLSAEQRGRRVQIKLGDLPVACADVQLIRQVWTNLLANALKFTRGREPAVIEVGCETADGRNAYFVRDNGAGFDMRYAGKLFMIFQRLHREEDFEGTGVGLAIAKRVIDRHGGRIWAEAARNQGATFYFTLEEAVEHE
jgi:PAS domain S-box-containing protein